MYQLYHNKKTCELKLSKAHKSFQNEFKKLIPDIPYHFNDLYTLCTNRKVLRKLGMEIKALWLAEAQMEILKIESIKI